LQIKLHEYQSSINDFHKYMGQKDGTRFQNPLNIAWSLIGDSESAAKWSYLAGHSDAFAKWSRIAAESVIYYLFGDWKNKQKHDDGTIDADRWFRVRPSSLNMTWTTYLNDGLCWAAVGGHWELVDKLLTFPQSDIEADDDGEVGRGYYLGLAAWWNDEKNLGWIKEVKELRGAGSKAYHLLCDAVAAIAARGKPALEKSLDQYVKLFVKRRDHEEQFPIAATFLWHVAGHKGLNPELPEDSAKYIFFPLEA
jgi:hypothetical protein